MKKKSKKKYLYELQVPVQETWVFHIEATSEEDALNQYENHGDTFDQIYTTGGWPNPEGRNVIFRVKEIL